MLIETYLEKKSESFCSPREVEVLDNEPAPELDALVKALSLACNVSVAFVNLIESERKWLKSDPMQGVSRIYEIASYIRSITQEDFCEISDLHNDRRFQKNTFLSDHSDVRFFSSMPINVDNGTYLGSLCLIDKCTKTLTLNQRQIFACIAKTVATILVTHRDKRNAILVRQKFADIIDSSHIGIWERNLQTGEVRYNERWTEITGKSVTDISSITMTEWFDLVHPADLISYRSTLDDHYLSQTNRYESEIRLRQHDGHWTWVLESGRIISWTREGKPEWIMGTLLDIHQRKNQEEELRKSQLFLDRTGTLAGVGGWEVDLINNSIYWSDETCRIHGVPLGFRPTMEQAIEFYIPSARPVILASVQEGISSGTGWDCELPLIRADQRQIWVRAVGSVESANGVPCRLVGAFQDITQKIQERTSLQSANDRLVLATNSGEVGIWEYDLLNGDIVSDAWMYRLFGIATSENISTLDLWLERIHPDDRIKIDEAARLAIDGEKPFSVEFRVIWSNGVCHYLKGSAIVKRDDKGEPFRMVGTVIDISVLKTLTMELAEQHELLRVTLQSIGDAVITTDASGNINWLNPIAERMSGWRTVEAKGRPLLEVCQLINEETRKPALNPITTCLEQKKTVGLANKTVLVSRLGLEYGIEDSASPIRNEYGDILGAVLVFHDVTEQRRLSGEMSFRASHDALTGLVNRTEFDLRLRRILQTAHIDESVHVLLYIDLDQFKLVNDACGHAAGDQLLQQVSKLFAETVRTRDTLARLGGDEFAILLEQCSAEHAQRVAQEICDRMDDFRFLHDERRFRIGASIGLVPVDNRWPLPEAIMQAADTSCYAAKEAGRNRVHTWFDTDIAMRTRHGEMQWTTRIEQALDDNRFVLYSQKIIPIKDQPQGLHAEVLLRMRDEDGVLINPGAFLPAAERFNLASRIDKWVLRQTVTWMKSLHSIDHIEKIGVNLSGQSVGDRAFHRWALELLVNAGADICRRLCIEITETAAVTNFIDAAMFIEKIREIGVRVALDDFGAGASSFGYLKKMQVDILKIDGQFVTNLMTDPIDEATVRCFADVARVVGVKTIAEFVDCPEVLNKLREIGIDFAQGFLLHRPAPIEELIVSKASAPNSNL